MIRNGEEDAEDEDSDDEDVTAVVPCKRRATNIVAIGEDPQVFEDDDFQE